MLSQSIKRLAEKTYSMRRISSFQKDMNVNEFLPMRLNFSLPCSTSARVAALVFNEPSKLTIQAKLRRSAKANKVSSSTGSVSTMPTLQ